MSMAFAAIVLVVLGQAQSARAADSQVKAIAPFVQSDVFAVVHVDVARLDVQQFSSRVFGEKSGGLVGTGKKLANEWSAGLKAAGAKDLYLVFSVIDMPGSPIVVVPVNDGAQAEGIARTIHADPKPIFGAIVAGKPETLARISREPASARPALVEAFGAADSDTVAIRLLVLPSADSLRVLEELVPQFPAELGGGPITDLTRGLLWAAVGIQNAEKPAVKIVAASRDAEAAKSLIKLSENVVAFLRRSPEVQKSIPGLSDVLPEFKPTVAENRVTLAVDAHQAAALADALLRPARMAAARTDCINNLKQIGLALHNYHTKHESFPPAYSRGKDGKPLLSWRVLVLPFLGEQALYDQFHLDEAWDSPHNRALISKMPAVYRCPAENEGIAVGGKTRYLARAGSPRFFGGQSPLICEVLPTVLPTRYSRLTPAMSTPWSGLSPRTGSLTLSPASRASSGATRLARTCFSQMAQYASFIPRFRRRPFAPC